MVKFVASDLDGTLLLNGAQSVDESAIQYINKLVDKGVIFAPASGRQITSLKRLLGLSVISLHILQRMVHLWNIRVKLLGRLRWIGSLR